MLLVLFDYCLNAFEYPLGAHVVGFYGVQHFVSVGTYTDSLNKKYKSPSSKPPCGFRSQNARRTFRHTQSLSPI